MIKDRETVQRLEESKAELEALCREIESWMKTAPKGVARVVRHGKSVHVFQRLEGSDKNGKYIPKKSVALAQALVQKKYNQKILEKSKELCHGIADFLRVFDPDAFIEIYESAGELRQQFITPLELPDAEFLAQWEAFQYEGKNFPEDQPQHYTSKDEQVRSKSEAMIADALASANIPYRYECPLDLGGIIVYPDFTILRARDRKEIYWEHLGMLDDDDYILGAMKKLRTYEGSGIFPGDRLIITCESARIPLTTIDIRQQINHYLS